MMSQKNATSFRCFVSPDYSSPVHVSALYAEGNKKPLSVTSNKNE